MEKKKTLIPGDKIGDYQLTEVFDEDFKTRTWLANQVSFSREVLFETLRTKLLSKKEVRGEFLAEIRAKARVDFPLIGSVLEAVELDEIVFYVRERLFGKTLEEMEKNGDKLLPCDVSQILNQIAKSFVYLHQMNMGVLPVKSRHIFINDRLVTRMVNMVIDAPFCVQRVNEDKVLIGRSIQNILEDGEGFTRLNSLCDVMQDGSRNHAVTWQQVYDLSIEIEEQLRLSKLQQENREHPLKVKDRSNRSYVWLYSLGVIMLLISLISALYFNGFFIQNERRDTSLMLYVNAEQISIDGISEELTPYFIDAYEVTIAEYDAFLKDRFGDDYSDLSLLSEEELENEFYYNYFPVSYKDWETLILKAERIEKWKGVRIGLNYPVFSVSYIGAEAYANWLEEKTGDTYRLPTEAEWLAAAMMAEENDWKIESFKAVDRYKEDINEFGLTGMAGSVSEWTSSIAIGLNGTSKYHIIKGASYRDPSKGIYQRAEVEKSTFRESATGFRLIKEIK